MKKLSVVDPHIAISWCQRSSGLCYVNLLKPYYRLPVDGVSPALVADNGLLVHGSDGVPNDGLLNGRLNNPLSLRALDFALAHLADFQQVELRVLWSLFLQGYNLDGR